LWTLLLVAIERRQLDHEFGQRGAFATEDVPEGVCGAGALANTSRALAPLRAR
jgi:hypothetical protein